MERRRVDLVVVYLEIDDGKAAYIAREKHVTTDDVHEVLGLKPHFFVRRGERGDEYSALGPNAGGRYLTIAMAPLGPHGDWRLISAYWLDGRRGRRLYEIPLGGES
jgi:hypothetical protein